jgi:hypothetical protein
VLRVGKWVGDKLTEIASTKVALLGKGEDDKDPLWEDVMHLSVPKEFNNLKSKRPKVSKPNDVGSLLWRKVGTAGPTIATAGVIKNDGTHLISTDSGASGGGICDPTYTVMYGVHIGRKGAVNVWVPFTDEQIARWYQSPAVAVPASKN